MFWNIAGGIALLSLLTVVLYSILGDWKEEICKRGLERDVAPTDADWTAGVIAEEIRALKIPGKKVKL